MAFDEFSASEETVRLTLVDWVPTMVVMEVQFSAEVQARLDELASETGRPQQELVEDVVAGFFDDLVEVRAMLNRRYDEVKNGKVKLVPGDEVMARLAAKSAARRSELA